MRYSYTAAVAFLVTAGIAAAQPKPGPAATRLLAGVTVKSPFGYGNLTLFPLVGRVSDHSGYILLDEAIRSGQVRVQEKDGGQVNTVRVRNAGKTYVFGIAGEIVSPRLPAPAVAPLRVTYLLTCKRGPAAPFSHMTPGRAGLGLSLG